MTEEKSSLGGTLKTGAEWRTSPPARLSLLSKQLGLLSFTAQRLTPGSPEPAQLGAHSHIPQPFPQKHHGLPSAALLTQHCAGHPGTERGPGWREKGQALLWGVSNVSQGGAVSAPPSTASVLGMHILLCPAP